jgi:hypothetical protein
MKTLLKNYKQLPKWVDRSKMWTSKKAPAQTDKHLEAAQTAEEANTITSKT